MSNFRSGQICSMAQLAHRLRRREERGGGFHTTSDLLNKSFNIIVLYTHPLAASSLGFPTAPTSPLGSLLLSLSTLVLIARCGERDNGRPPPGPFGPTERVARRDLVVELERCGLEEGPFMVDVSIERW